MWFLMRSMLGLVALVTVGYFAFFVELGDRPLASHLTEVWQSDTVQSKVSLVRDGVRNELEDRLAAAAERETRDVVRERLGGGPTEFADEDRDTLSHIVDQ